MINNKILYKHKSMKKQIYFIIHFNMINLYNYKIQIFSRVNLNKVLILLSDKFDMKNRKNLG